MTSPADTSPTDIVAGLRAVVRGTDHLRSILAARLGIRVNELTALGYLEHTGEATPKELSERLGITTGSATGIVDRLEAAGFLARSAHPHDRRSILLRTTPAGSHAVQWVDEHYVEAVDRALDEIPGVTRDQVASLLRTTGAHLSAVVDTEPQGRTTATPA